MRPKKYPYSGKARIVRKEMPRLIKLGNIALKSGLIKHIDVVVRAGYGQTRVVFKMPKPFFNYEEKAIMVYLDFEKVVNILNQY